MSRAILDSSASTPEVAAGGFADLEPLDQELASQLPGWDLVPPHAFLVRKPRKPKPVAVIEPPVEVTPPAPVAVEPEPIEPRPVVEAPDVEVEADPAPLAAEAVAPEPMNDADAELPVTDIEAEAAASPAVDADKCSKCDAQLEPGSAFCSECGHKQ